MSLITANFTDVHGTHHAAAVFKVLTVNVYSNQSKTLQVDAKNEITVSDEGQLNADFRAQFWVSQEAKDSGMLHFNFPSLKQVVNLKEVHSKSQTLLTHLSFLKMNYCKRRKINL